MPTFKTRAAQVSTLVAYVAGYMLIMTAGWLVNGYDYGTVGGLFWQTPFLAAALIYTYALIRVYRVQVWRAARLRAPASLWAVVLILLLVGTGAVYALANGFHGRWATIPAVFVATMMVGLAEEGMFRGVLLTGLARRMSTRTALTLSSVTFGLLHAVNVFAREPVGAVIVQVVFTMFVGYVLGNVYIRTGGSIVIVALLHGLYDFVAFCTSYAGSHGGHTLAFVGWLNLAAWVGLAIVLLVRNRRGVPDLTAAWAAGPEPQSPGPIPGPGQTPDG